MLVARRDPVLDHGHDPSRTRHDDLGSLAGVHGHIGPQQPRSRFARLVSGLQIFGSVLAVPLGLASGYSIYHANFSVEARCQGLRSNIVSMLDKNADASTLRTLVHHDVAAFEQSCVTVDPEAVAAFKNLLRPQPKPVAATAHAPAQKEVHESDHEPVREAARKEAARPETRHELEPKRIPRNVKQAKRTVPVETRPVERDTVKSDADWIDAVRHALVDHPPIARAEAAESPAVSTPAPAAKPMGPVPVLGEQPQARPAAETHAPALPPATAVARVPAPEADDGHPVPPAPIPNVAPPLGQ